MKEIEARLDKMRAHKTKERQSIWADIQENTGMEGLKSVGEGAGIEALEGIEDRLELIAELLYECLSYWKNRHSVR